MVIRSVLGIAIAASAACSYGGSFRDCEVSCTPLTGCPAGFECSPSEGLCRAAGVSCSSILGDAAPDALRQFSSCDGLAATCGPNGNDNCCSTAVPIPGGMFYRGTDSATDGMYTDTSHPAMLSPFVLDKYEITVGRFRQFVNAGMGTKANPPAVGAGARMLNGMGNQGGWSPSFNASLTANMTALVAAVKCNATTWTDTAGANESNPINCITWYEAMAFCIWDGGYLPTEAEWNFAAAGGGEQRAYPWSSPAGSTVLDCSYANYYINSPAGTHCVNGTTGGTNRVGSESPKGDGKWGQSDLAGNVFEWVLDWYASPYPNPCSDCANLTPASDRVTRGASWNIVSYVRAAYRAYVTPAFRGYDLGVRCARSP